MNYENRLKQIRESEKQSHIEMYSNSELYKEGSWLRKPIKTVLDIIPLFNDYSDLRRPFLIFLKKFLLLTVTAVIENARLILLPLEVRGGIAFWVCI